MSFKQRIKGKSGKFCLLFVLLGLLYSLGLYFSFGLPEESSTISSDVEEINPVVKQVVANESKDDALLNVIKEELPIPDEFLKKTPRAEILARIEKEKEQLPKRGNEPRLPIIIVNDEVVKQHISLPSHSDYRRYKAEVVDYRETLEPVPITSNFNYNGIVTCEYLISLNDGAAAIINEEYYHDYKDGTREYIGKSEYSASQIVAQVKASESLLAFRSAVEEFGFKFAEVLLTNEKGDSLVVVTSEEATLDTVRDARQIVEMTGMCNFVEVDSVMRTAKAPNDTMYSEQWGLAKIGAPTAWNTTTGNTSIKVGVVDTGVAFFHSDLKGNLLSINGYYGISTFAGLNTTDEEWFIDCNGHGTHVNGIIGAVGNDGYGVSGVNWKTKIINVNYTYWGYCSDAFIDYSAPLLGFATDSVAGFEYCRQQGAKVINYSSGTLATDIGQTSINTFNTGINSLRNAGIILVCAAGNDTNNNDSLANYPSNCSQDNVLAVAATTQDDKLASFSNYGLKSVDIAAPGYSILSTYVLTEDGENFTATWAYLGGTSMAAPMVTGSIALIWSKYPNESYSQIINRVLNSADKISAFSSKIPDGRRLNVATAMNYLNIPGNVKATQGTQSDKVTISWDASTGASYYRVFYATSNDSSKATALSSWQTARTYNHTTATKGTTYYYWVKAATSSSGANASGYSAAATGWVDAGSDYADTYEPNDKMAEAIVISPSTTKKSHGEHALVYDETASGYKEDRIDIFKINMTMGTTYVFESQTVGGSSDTKDPYGMIYDLNGNFLFGDDDSSDNSGGYDFKVVYTARYTGVHYLAVRAYNTTSLKYKLSYYVGNENERNYDQVLTYDDVPADGDTISIKLNSSDEGDMWIFEMNDRPSWVSSIALKIGDSTQTLTGTSKSVTFAGEGVLDIKVDKNTSTSSREWKNFNIVLEMGYAKIQIVQNGASNLAAPGNVSATDKRTDNITVTWNSVTGAKGYRVARAATATGTKTHFSWQTSTSFADTSATSGATYYYWVQAATNADGSGTVSEYSAYDTGTRGTPAATKYSLTVTNGTGTGEYVQGQKITIKADAAPLGKVFNQWTGNGVAHVDNVSKETAVVTMPAQAIRLVAEYTTKNSGNDPWGEEPVSDPSSRLQLVYVNVIIDGVPAVEGDWLAAFCGNQMRGKMKLPAGGKAWFKLTTSVTGEKITFKTYDAGTGKILDAAETISSIPGDDTTYDENSPLVIYSNSNDPYGNPVAYPSGTVLLVKAKVTKYDVSAARGDILAVFCGNELRGKATFTSTDGSIEIKVNRSKGNGEQLTFFLWDVAASEQTQTKVSVWKNNAYVTGDSYTTEKDVDDIGYDKVVKLEVSAERDLALNFIKGWNAFSLNVETNSCTLQEFFGSNFSKVERIETFVPETRETLVWAKGKFEDFTTIEPARQYWVRLSSSVNMVVTGLPVDLNDASRNTFTFTMDTDNSGAQRTTWFSLPYILQDSTELKQTLMSLLELNSKGTIAIERILSSNGKVFKPGDSSSQTLTTMMPGEVYWLRMTKINNTEGSVTFSYGKANTTSMANAIALKAALKSIYPEDWPLDSAAVETDKSLNRNLVVSLDYFGTQPRGVSIAAFRVSDDQFLGAASFSIDFNTGNYKANIPVTQYNGTEVYFQLYDQGTAEVPYNQPFDVCNELGEKVTFSLVDKDEDNDGQQDDLPVELAVSGDKPQYRIEFVLTYGTGNDQLVAVQKDQTPLVQYIERGGDATAPVVAAPVHWTAVSWDDQANLFTNVTCSNVVQIVFVPAQEEQNFHSADQNQDWEIDGNELGRVINIFKAGKYHIEDNGTYGLGAGSEDGQPHSADQNQDWKIDGNELGRVINIFKAGGYHIEVDGSFGLGKQQQ